MMSDWPVLSLVIFLPLVGVLFILATPGNDQAQVDSNCRWQALVVSVGVFLLSLLIWYNFDPTTAEFQLVERYEWVPGSAFAYHVRVDGIPTRFVLLSTLLTPLRILARLQALQPRLHEHLTPSLALPPPTARLFRPPPLLFPFLFLAILP